MNNEIKNNETLNIVKDCSISVLKYLSFVLIGLFSIYSIFHFNQKIDYYFSYFYFPFVILGQIITTITVQSFRFTIIEHPIVFTGLGYFIFCVIVFNICFLNKTYTKDIISENQRDYIKILSIFLFCLNILIIYLLSAYHFYSSTDFESCFSVSIFVLYIINMMLLYSKYVLEIIELEIAFVITYMLTCFYGILILFGFVTI